MPAKLRAAGYVRVSTAGQAEEGSSLPEQREAIAARAAAEGWELVEIYADEGLSGRSEERPELQRLLRDLRRLDRVIVTELSRMGRRAAGMLELFDRFENEAVALVSIRQSIDTSTAAGKLLRNVLVSVAEFESEQLGERVSAVARSKVAKGEHHGRPPFGYLSKRGLLEPDPKRAPIVRRMFEQAAGGKTQRSISRQLNAEGVKPMGGKTWAQSQLGRILRNPTYKGVVVINGEEFAGTHEPIVTPELWNEVAAIREKRTRTKEGAGPGRRPAGRQLFTRGLLRCGYCGAAMTPRTYTREPREEYRCSTRIEQGPDACRMGSVPREAIDTAALAYFEEVGLDAERMRAEIAAAVDDRRRLVADQLREATAEERRAADRLERVRRAFQDGKLEPDDWTEQRTQLTGELDGARAALKQAEAREAELATAEVDAANPESEAQRRLEAIREAVAGKVAASADDIEALRTALTEMFEAFMLWPIDAEEIDREPGELEAADAIYRHAISEDAGRPVDAFAIAGYRIVPMPRAETVEGIGEAFLPILKRRSAGLGSAKTTDDEGLTR